MKRNLFLLLVSLFCWQTYLLAENTPERIRISTSETDLIYQTASDGRLYQIWGRNCSMSLT